MVFFTANGDVLFFSKEAKSDRKKKYKTSDRRNTAGVSRRGTVGVTTKKPFPFSCHPLRCAAHQRIKGSQSRRCAVRHTYAASI
ncbi:MAG: hypothetical protein IJ870_05475, partial [Alphaproteobacteria bacterium]|nr:hypothetical protein [Alphaproteobacteria bacterium]